MWTRFLLTNIVFLTIFQLEGSVGFETDITADRKFNCRWLGGSDAKLICDCITKDEEFYIQEKSIPSYDVYAIIISNCGTVRFGPKAINDMRSLRIVELTNIDTLKFEENSMAWKGYIRQHDFIIEYEAAIPSLKILISNSTVENMAQNTFKGRYNNLVFNNVLFKNIEPFAFTTIEQLQDLKFNNCKFITPQSQAFKKFLLQNLVITNCIFETIPSRMFNDITVVYDFLLKNVTVDTIRPSGFIIRRPQNVEISNCNITNLNGEGFNVVTYGKVLVKNNTFNSTGVGGFKGFSVDKDEVPDKQIFTFEGNVFQEVNKNTLSVNTEYFIPKYYNLKFSEVCDCTPLMRYFTNGENEQELNCREENGDWISVYEFKKMNCSIMQSKVGIVVIVVSVCLSVFVLALIGSLCFIRKLYRCGKYGENDGQKQGKFSMIVPDGRTYRETEVHVIVERADLLTTDL